MIVIMKTSQYNNESNNEDKVSITMKVIMKTNSV